jgi:hypothetical protein
VRSLRTARTKWSTCAGALRRSPANRTRTR